MKNIKLLVVSLLFSSLLAGCGMKGPLYRPPVAQPTPPAMENTETQQDKTTTATTEELTDCSENTAAEDKQQAVTEQDKTASE